MAAARAGMGRHRRRVKVHRLGDQSSNLFGGLDQMAVGEVGVVGGGTVPPVAEQLFDQGQGLAGHDGVAGRGVAMAISTSAPVSSYGVAQYRGDHDGFVRRQEPLLRLHA